PEILFPHTQNSKDGPEDRRAAVRRPASAILRICRGESPVQTAKRAAQDSSSCGPPRETLTLPREQDRPCVQRQIQATRARANQADRTEALSAPSPQPS